MGRIRDTMLSTAVLRALADGDALATKALRGCSEALGEEKFLIFCRVVDGKELYGNRIGKLFQDCDNYVGRFIYHVEVELPNQRTGRWSIANTSQHFALCSTPSFAAARRFGEPNRLWALEQPPPNPDYDYPIL